MGTRLSRILNLVKALDTALDLDTTNGLITTVDTVVDTLTTNLAALDAKVDTLDTVADGIAAEFDTGGIVKDVYDEFQTGGQIPTIVTNTTP